MTPRSNGSSTTVLSSLVHEVANDRNTTRSKRKAVFQRVCIDATEGKLPDGNSVIILSFC